MPFFGSSWNDDDDEPMSWSESRRRKDEEEESGLTKEDKKRIAQEIVDGTSTGLNVKDEEIFEMVKEIEGNK